MSVPRQRPERERHHERRVFDQDLKFVSHERALLRADAPGAVAHGEYLAVIADDGVGRETLAQAPQRLFAPLACQAPARGVVEEHDLGAMVVVHDAPVGEQVFEHFPAYSALLHAYLRVSCESVVVHGS